MSKDVSRLKASARTRSVARRGLRRALDSWREGSSSTTWLPQKAAAISY